MDDPQPQTNHHHPDPLALVLRRILVGLGTVIVLAGLSLGYLYAISPAAIRQPAATHYHFRLQIINNGTPVNFADDQFQTPFNTDICTAALTQEPVHFHDHLDQFVHIHWNHLTGGIVLKDYGWNFIGGSDQVLGYRFDHFPHLVKVPVHGRALPKPATDAKFFVYTGTKDKYAERSWNDFMSHDLRDFFTASPVKPTARLLDRLIPVALAHGDTADGADDAKLTQLNDVLGSVVIFAQKDRPTTAQIKDRFNHLVPLPTSSCGG